MGVAFLGLFLLWRVAAFGVEEVVRDDGAAAPEVVRVVAWLSAARSEVHGRLRALGYRERHRRDRDVYVHPKMWRPSVHLWPHGRDELRRGPARVSVFNSGPQGAQSSIVPLCVGFPVRRVDGLDDVSVEVVPASCLHLDGAFVSRRLLRGAKGDVMERVGGALQRWSGAVAAATWRERLAQLPALLAARAATAPSEEIAALELLAWGCGRTATPEGRDARGVAAAALTDLRGAQVLSPAVQRVAAGCGLIDAPEGDPAPNARGAG